MTDERAPLEPDKLMNLYERIEQLPPRAAEWVGRLFDECLRARLHEAELAGTTSLGSDQPTNSENELAQLALDTAEWLKTLWNIGYMGAGSFPAQPRSTFPSVEVEDVVKSTLFARIREGKRPLPFPPPTQHGQPWHELVEGDDATHPVAARLVRDEHGVAIAATIEGCHDWRLVSEIVADHEYLVQHQGQGPLFRLSLGEPLAFLRREPPRWQRPICLQERGGFRSYTLDWTHDDGRVEAVSLRAATWERAESEASHWIANEHPHMYGQVSFTRHDAGTSVNQTPA